MKFNTYTLFSTEAGEFFLQRTGSVGARPVKIVQTVDHQRASGPRMPLNGIEDKGFAGEAARDHQRYVELEGHRIDDPGQGVLLGPDFNIRVGILPE